MQAKLKAWMEVNGAVVIGEGRARLLALVDETGSINKAAKVMRMSYRAAWGKIREAEKRLGYPLLESRVGGASGGGSRLTDQGRKLVDGFYAFDRALNRSAKKHFADLFPQDVDPSETSDKAAKES